MPTVKIGISPVQIELETDDLKLIWNKLLKPFLKWGIVFLTLLAPYGTAIWALLYWSLQNLVLVRNWIFYIQIISGVALLFSLYTFIWAKYFYPRLQSWTSQTVKSEIAEKAEVSHLVSTVKE